jgi:oligopeptidase B
MQHLKKTYHQSVQQIDRSNHYVNFGKTPSTIDIFVTENYPNDQSNILKITKFTDDSKKKSDLEPEFDESNYMDPPIESKDEYYWLRDDSRTNEKVLKMLRTENELVETLMGSESSKEFQSKLYHEIKSYVKESNDSLPMPHGEKGWDSDYYYWVRTLEGKSYPIHMRTKRSNVSDEKTDEVLLDENVLAQGHNTFDLSCFEITNDHKYMSYGVDYNGSEDYDLKIFDISDISSKPELFHDIPALSYCDYFWYEENGLYYIYYMLHTETRKSYKLMRYDLQTKTHLEIYSNTDPLFEISANVSDDNRYIMINANSYTTHDVYMFKNSEPSVLYNITKIESDHKYSVEIHNSTVFIITNANGATNFKLMRCDISNTNKEEWIPYITNKEEWIPYMEYDSNINIIGIKVLKNYLLVLYKTKGNSKIKVINVANDYNRESEYDIEIPNVESISLVDQNIYDTDDIVLTYTDLKQPSTMLKYNLSTKNQTVLKVREVPNYYQELYHTERIYADSHDNDKKKIPISLIYKKNMFKRDGTNPLYLYGYGSYGITIDPSFKHTILPLLDRGFVYAIAHVRGGAFLGTDWYEDGKMLKKMNTFKDFISCAEHLIKKLYTSKGNIVTEGRSAGGLLVGATMVMRPDLFRTVIAGVPFVDVLNTMCDPTIPLTTQEWEQWGNPNEKIYFEYMKQYSPYDNIQSGVSYPNILALAGLNDPRVQYWEPAKFIAKLRANDSGTGSSLKLLKTEMEQGHFGNTDRYKYMRELAFDYAFVFSTYDINE